MDYNKMNKKGTIVLRDVMFMIILFGGIMALMSIAVLNIAEEYGNTNAISEYNALGISGLGNEVSGNISSTIDDQREATAGEGEGEEGAASSIGIVTDVIGGAAKIVLGVFKAPTIISNALSTMFGATRVPQQVVVIISVMILGLIFVVIIFGIITALLKGGRM